MDENKQTDLAQKFLELMPTLYSAIKVDAFCSQYFETEFGSWFLLKDDLVAGTLSYIKNADDAKYRLVEMDELAWRIEEQLPLEQNQQRIMYFTFVLSAVRFVQIVLRADVENR